MTSHLRRTVAPAAALATVVGSFLLASPASATAHAPAPDRLFVNVAGTAGSAAATLTGQARSDALTIAGVRVPRFLYGTAWKEDRTEELTGLALRAGFRGIDTANQRKHYFEEGVGRAVRAHCPVIGEVHDLGRQRE